MSEETLFSKIVKGELPADIVFQDKLVTAFRDINPQAPTHILIVPNKIIPTVNDVTEEDEGTLGHMFVVARQLAEAKDLAARLCDVSKAVSDTGFLDLPLAPAGFTELRYSLLPPEIDRYRRLAKEAAQALETSCRNAQPGDTELDVAAALAFECRKRDILTLVNLVGGDERIARYRHPLPGANQIRRTMLVAVTGRRHGLHVSLTRLVSFDPLDADLAARHRAVTAVDARFILESRAGVAVGQVVRRAIDQYAGEGFPGEWELHHQGGLTGYAGREIFGIPASEYRLESNQVLTWNPSITGTKSEDTILLTEEGPEVLTRTGDWPEVEVELPLGRLLRPSIKTP